MEEMIWRKKVLGQMVRVRWYSDRAVSGLRGRNEKVVEPRVRSYYASTRGGWRLGIFSGNGSSRGKPTNARVCRWLSGRRCANLLQK